MHKDYSLDEDSSSSSKLSSRGVSIYYLGSTIFVAGIALMILGVVLVFLFQIHYGSQPEEIMYTIISIASGIILILIGISLMMRQTRKGYVIVVVSVICSLLSMFLFITNYLQNWYYPLVSYVFGLYVIGFLALLGNAFASVIVWIIGNGPSYNVEEKERSPLYTDEEIQRDIEEATKKSLETAVAELQFELGGISDDLVVGKNAPKIPGTIIRVKDDIDEVLSLRQTLAPGTTEKWGSVGIDKASLQLVKTISQEKKKESIFARFRGSSAKKKSAKRSKQAKKKKEIERKKQEKIETERMKEEARKKENKLRIKKEGRRTHEKDRAKKEAKIMEKKAREKAIMLEKKKKS